MEFSNNYFFFNDEDNFDDGLNNLFNQPIEDNFSLK